MPATNFICSLFVFPHLLVFLLQSFTVILVTFFCFIDTAHAERYVVALEFQVESFVITPADIMITFIV